MKIWHFSNMKMATNRGYKIKPMKIKKLVQSSNYHGIGKEAMASWVRAGEVGELQATRRDG